MAAPIGATVAIVMRTRKRSASPRPGRHETQPVQAHERSEDGACDPDQHADDRTFRRISWEAELERCYASVLRGLIAACGSRELAEDGLQDALVAALKPGVRGTVERLDGWLYVVALRALCKGQWRRRLERSLGLAQGSTPRPSEDRVAAIELLGHLTQRQREFVVARYWLGMSFHEIAEHFGVSVGTATSTVTRSLSRLRREMGPEEVRAWMSSN